MKDYPSQRITSGLSCREVSACASDYLDDHLPLLLRLRTGLHLASCADCRAYVRQVVLIQDAVSRLLKHLPSPIIRVHLRQRFRMRRAY